MAGSVSFDCAVEFKARFCFALLARTLASDCGGMADSRLLLYVSFAFCLSGGGICSCCSFVYPL